MNIIFSPASWSFSFRQLLTLVFMKMVFILSNLQIAMTFHTIQCIYEQLSLSIPNDHIAFTQGPTRI